MSDQSSEPRQAPAPAEPIPPRPTAADMIKDYRENDPLRAIRH
jgi:hypothetical protein